MKWIRTNDRSPERDQIVLTIGKRWNCKEEYGVPVVCRYRAGEYTEMWEEYERLKPTHWAAIVDPNGADIWRDS